MTPIFSCMIQEEEYDIPEELEDVIGRCMVLIFHPLSGIMILEELKLSHHWPLFNFVIEKLLSGLKDKDTVVRWSAAKG